MSCLDIIGRTSREDGLKHKKSRSASPIWDADLLFCVLCHLCCFQCHPTQLVMPSVVPMAVRMVTSVWITSFQMFFFSVFMLCLSF